MDTLSVNNDGIEVPEEFENADAIVIRTPSNTIDMSSGFQAIYSGDRFPLVTPEDFDENDDPHNPKLTPDKVSFKEYGSDAVQFTVTVE